MTFVNRERDVGHGRRQPPGIPGEQLPFQQVLRTPPSGTKGDQKLDSGCFFVENEKDGRVSCLPWYGGRGETGFILLEPGYRPPCAGGFPKNVERPSGRAARGPVYIIFLPPYIERTPTNAGRPRGKAPCWRVHIVFPRNYIDRPPPPPGRSPAYIGRPENYMDRPSTSLPRARVHIDPPRIYIEESPAKLPASSGDDPQDLRRGLLWWDQRRPSIQQPPRTRVPW